MANFFLDNPDIQLLFDSIDLAEIASLQEDGFEPGPDRGVEAPADAAEALDGYRRILEITGDVAANHVAPRAEQVDREGNTLNPDGTVTLHPAVRANLDVLAQADLMGFTLPRRYGGLNCPNLVYTMAIEIISRADASLMNIFGLQGIAETIHAFADQATRDQYLPRFARGELTGAMVLTEPDAGSDLQAIAMRAEQDEAGEWRLNGVKRFITNGCGEVLLTLARSEPDVDDGRGLSLFLVERSPQLRVRHIEDKLGIHGSPTCELVFQDVPARLIGERQVGLIRYVMALMNGARVGIAAQSLGIAEAAFRVARAYAAKRKQFGVPIERLPAVAEMITDMKVALEGARALVYETSRICDLENNNLRVLEERPPTSAEEKKARRSQARTLKRLGGMLTPMSKYRASEMCVEVANDALQVLGGSGYMRDYPVERHLRDARITTIYEGTSQLQIVAAVRGVCSGAFEAFLAAYEQPPEDAELRELHEKLQEGRGLVVEGITRVKGERPDYMDLHGRSLVDAAVAVLTGHLLLRQAARDPRKRLVTRRFVETSLPTIRRDIARVCSGDTLPLDQYETLAGPPPKAT